jgi:hypothetical protein
MNHEGQARTKLSYARPRPAAQDAGKGALLCTILTVPGLAGFCLLGTALLYRSKLGWTFRPDLVICLWVVAFVCAVINIKISQNKPQPWPAMLCLIINMTSVIFTLSPFGWCLALLIWLAMHPNSW